MSLDERISELKNTTYISSFDEYELNHYGLSRWALYKINRPLYDKLLKTGEIKQIPLKVRLWKNIDLEKYYNDNYSGLTRGEVRKIDPSFYNVLLRTGYIELIPRNNLINLK